MSSVSKVLFNKFAFIIILIVISNIFCKDSNLSKFIRSHIKSEKNSRFKTLRSNCEKKSKERESVNDPDVLHEWKINFIKQIMDRSTSKNDKMSSEYTTNKFHSFLNIKINFPEADDPKKFFGSTLFLTDVTKIPVKGSGKECWSGSYWPMRNGLISVRYNETPLNSIGNWDTKSQSFLSYYTYKKSKSVCTTQSGESAIISKPGSALTSYIANYFSAAEKYDYLCGDKSFTLTKWMFWKADKYQDSTGDIPEWFGVCHGWAPASFHFNRPTKPVTLYAADSQTKVTFYPDDIKALASQMWAQASYTTRFVGQLCPYSDKTQIKRDAVTGLYTDPKCSSIDAGSFIIIIGNQMGINKLNFAFDPNPDGEVWNQPVNSYTIEWYNISDDSANTNFSDNLTPLLSLKNSNNPFLNFVYNRSQTGTVNIIGAYITVTYAMETKPEPQATALDNISKTDEYFAAIKLDANNNILGGEWMNNDHPNFVWKPEESVRPTGHYDANVPDFTSNLSSAALRNLTSLCKRSSLYGQPMRNIVNYLVAQSSKA